MRHGLQPGRDHPVPGDSGAGRRRAPAFRPGSLAGYLPTGKAGTGQDEVGLRGLDRPIVGPTLGGWLCVNYNWRWIFLINVPVGVVALIAAYALVDDPD